MQRERDEEVSFQWKNPDFLLKNPDFLLKSVDFIMKQSPDVEKRTDVETTSAQAATRFAGLGGGGVSSWQAEVRSRGRQDRFVHERTPFVV